MIFLPEELEGQEGGEWEAAVCSGVLQTAGRKWFCQGSGASGFYATEPPERCMADVSG